MAWNNQGGPWGGGGGGQGGGQSPWSRGPGGGGQPPDFEEMLRRGQDRMKNLVPGGMGPGKVGALIVGVAVLLWLASGLYQVQPAERGVPLVFGKFNGEPDRAWPALELAGADRQRADARTSMPRIPSRSDFAAAPPATAPSRRKA